MNSNMIDEDRLDALAAELDSCNSYNVKTDSGELEIETPRDRDSELEPLLVKKGQRRLSGFDQKILTLHLLRQRPHNQEHR